MASTEYYTADQQLPDPSKYHSPVSPVSDLNKPLPAPNQYATFPPTHSYDTNLSYSPHHHSQESVDAKYRPESFGSYYSGDPQKPLPQDPFADHIPLHSTNHLAHNQQSGGAGGEADGFSPAPRRSLSLPTGGRRDSITQAQRRPWFVYIITGIQIAVFCALLGRNQQLQGTPIGIKPYFNPMIGPSSDCLINMGARFVPCMRPVPQFNNTIENSLFPCPNRTTNDLQCTLGDWCGFSGDRIPKTMGGKSSSSSPDQWYRFILPMFYHAGIIHLAFNMFLQVTLGGDMEKEIGFWRFIVIYFCSGIFGFLLGGNLGAHGQPSVGASGCLFGIFALVLLDLLYSWNERPSPGKDLAFLILDIVISFVLGLLPAIDNFAHIGGFLSGIALGLVFMRSPPRLSEKIGLTSDQPYTPASITNPYNSSSGDNTMAGFRGVVKQPIGFFKGRKPLWWAWWLVRAGMLALLMMAFIVLINNFYSARMRECSWCKYLSCLPISNWCEMYDWKVIQVTQ